VGEFDCEGCYVFSCFGVEEHPCIVDSQARMKLKMRTIQFRDVVLGRNSRILR
jgi:hypothetical protein